MTWTIYDYVDHRGVNTVKSWMEKELQKPERVRMTQKIDLLRLNGGQLSPELLAGPLNESRHLYKIRINGRVAPRLLLCKGPLRMESEFTLLLGVSERDGRLPEGAIEKAEQYRQSIIDNPNRRCLHE